MAPLVDRIWEPGYPPAVSAVTRILVADRDRSVHELVRSALAGGPYELSCVVDGQEALKEAGRWGPQLIILEAALPRMDGVSLVRMLRSKPEFALVPAIFLDSPDHLKKRISGFKLGADDFMPKPVKSDEIGPRVSLALQARDEARKTVQNLTPDGPEVEFSLEVAVFRGSLDEVGLPSLLTMIELEKKSGILVLILEPEKEKVRIYVRDGRVVVARYDTREEPRNTELIHRLLARSGGKFDFRPGRADRSDEVNLPTAHLLLDGARLLDEETQRIPKIELPDSDPSP